MAIKAEDFQPSFVDFPKIHKAAAFIDDVMSSPKRRELYRRGSTINKGIHKEEWGIDINLSLTEQELYTLRGLYTASGWEAEVEKKNTGRSIMGTISLTRSIKIN